MLIDVARRFTRDCHELGITIHGTFILGLPGETRETIEETIRFATEINPHTIQVSLAAPYPGTFLYNQAVENGWLDTAHAELIDDHGIQIAPLHYPHLSHSEIFELGRDLLPALLFPRRQDRLDRRRDGAQPRDDAPPPARGRRVLPILARAGDGALTLRRLIVCADDFGLDEAVNEAVEQASRDGILTAASLMVGAPAAADAVARARRLPRLHVGLHLVVVDGMPVLPAAQIPALVDGNGVFCADLARAGCRFFFDPRARRQLAAEIRAQFAAFRATGLGLDHANAHCHMHLHPTVGRLLVAIGREFGLKAVRIPAEPLLPLRRAAARFPDLAAAALHAPFAALLRRRVRRAGLAANDHLLGLAWTGGMTEARLLSLLAALPPGVSELYLHPAAARTPSLVRAMPDYRQTEELAALLSPAVRRRVEGEGLALVGYGALG